jgi:hypothetical protein
MNMAGLELHTFDLHLCSAALCAPCRCIHSQDGFAERYFAVMEKVLPAPLWALIRPSGEIYQVPIVQLPLLSTVEFSDLETAFIGFDERYTWHADPVLLRRRLQCVPEIRTELGAAEATAWSETSVRLVARLEEPDLRIDEGIRTIHEWVVYVRELLGAMGAMEFLPYPDGLYPTATNREPPVLSPKNVTKPPAGMSERELNAVEKLRRAIHESINGPKTSPDRIVEEAQVNRQLGRQMLRWLQANEEYDGFAREQPQRYREGRPNER